MDIEDQERAKYEDKIISLQMNLKLKSEKYNAAKHDLMLLEKKLQRQTTDLNSQRRALESIENDERKRNESAEVQLKKREQECDRLRGQIAELENAHKQELQTLEAKLQKREQRGDQ